MVERFCWCVNDYETVCIFVFHASLKGTRMVFRSNLDEQTMSVLVNKTDLCREAPIESLQSTNAHQDPQLRSNLFLSLLTCGATVNSPQGTYH
ncbi:unnamed protein product [Toxocara canis]|uniref:Kinesin motor domain-containing protein n=1 Tax=Toxocara canis TaxID=6265 RepID=A0A183VGA1_TOXCA|nr:unnamed protein product [Toxocara canis]